MDDVSISYKNDRYMLILLNHIDNPNFFQRRMLRKLSNRYNDNHLYEYYLKDDLIKSGYIIDECEREKSASGQTKILNYKYRISENGIKALSNGRYVSEYKTQIRKRANRRLGAFSTTIGILGGLLGIYASFKSCNTEPQQMEISHLNDEYIPNNTVRKSAIYPIIVPQNIEFSDTANSLKQNNSESNVLAIDTITSITAIPASTNIIAIE